MKRGRTDRSARRALAVACGSLCLPIGTHSLAQSGDVETRGVLKINVTGSNIARIEGETGLPLQVMTREELLRGGVQTIQDLLDRISANQSFGGFNEAMGEGSSLVGYTAASLRGLGAQRTLVLLNGKRLAPYALSGGQSVDLSGIPMSALDRVEILKDGASAIYGTDAIGGVINFILRKDYQGAEVYGNYYGTEHGGGNNWRANGTVGYGDLVKDKFNFFFSADYFKQQPLKASQREFSKTAYVPSLGFDRTSANSFPANIWQTDFTTDPPTRYGFFGQLNPTIPYPSGATASSCAPPYSFPTQQFPFLCRFDFASVIETIPESEKTNVIGRFTWQINPDHQFFAEATYYRGDFIQRVSPTPILPAPESSLLPTSPFYPTAYVAGIHNVDPRTQRPYNGDPTQPLELSYRTLELGPRTDEAKTNQWSFVAGLQGTIRDWDYQLSGNWVRNEQRDYLVSGLVSDRQFSALLHSGVVNPFGFNTDSVLQLMRATQIIGQANDNRASNYGGDLKLSRNVFALPAGPVALAVGIEGRKESLEQMNSDFIVTGDVSGYGGAVPSLTQSYRTVWALFGEVNLPVAKTLEANVAVRYDHYSDFGSTVNPKFTLRWQPSRNVLLRGTYGTGFRAPTLQDLYLPSAKGYANDDFDDPIRCPVTQADSDCRLSSGYGVPYTAYTGGNPFVQPEKSTQWNAGIVWQPVAEFSASADYFWVEVRNLIFFAYTSTIDHNFAALGPTQIVRKPPDAEYPNLPGPIDYILEQPVNLGTLQTSGFDVDLSYRLPTPIGQFTATLNGTYVSDYQLTGATTDAFPGGAGSRGPLGAISRWRHYAALDWGYGAWGATLANTYQDGYSEPCLLDGAGNSLDPSGCTTRRVSSYSPWDIQGRYTGFKNVALTLGIRNLFDIAPPLSNQSSAFQAGYDPSYGSPMGRTFYGAIRYAFK